MAQMTLEALTQEIAELEAAGNEVVAKIGTVYAVVYVNGTRTKIIAFIN